MRTASILQPPPRPQADTFAERARHGGIIGAVVICLVLPWCVQPFAQQTKPLEPKAALSSIVSLPAADVAAAIAIVRQCNARDAWVLSAMLIAAAGKSSDTSDLAKSTFLYECAAEAARIAKADAPLAEAEYRLGSNLLQLHNYRRAEEVLLEGVSASEKGKLDIPLINNLSTLGALYIRLAKYDAAERVSKQALVLITGSPKRASIPFHYGEAMVCSNLGTIAEWNGEHSTALDFFRRAVELFGGLDEKIGGYKSSALDNLILIGEAYYYLGDHRSALDSYAKALAGAEEKGFKKLQQSALNDLGILYMDQGDFVKATEFFTKSLHASGAGGDMDTTTLATCNLGVSSERQGRYERAAEIFSDCLKLAEQSARPNFEILALEGLATAYRGESKHEVALEYLDRALMAATKLRDRLRQSELLWRKGVIFYDRREYERSLDFSNRALLLAEDIHETNYSYLALDLMGKNYVALGRNESANSVLGRAIEAVEQIRRQVGGQEQQRAYFLERKIEPYQLMVDLLIGQSRPERALEFAERAKSRALLDLVGNAKSDISRAMTTDERAEERRLDGQINALNIQLYRQYQQQNPDTLKINAVRHGLKTARIEYDSFLDRMFATHPQLRVDRAQVAPITREETRLALVSEDAAAVEFQVLDDKVIVLAVDFVGQVPRITPHSITISKKKLSERIEDFRIGITDKRIGLERVSSELYQLLLAPAANIIDGKKTIVLIPDDVLWELPFQALKDSSGRYFVENHSLFYAPSLTALREILKRESSSAARRDLKAFPTPSAGLERPLLAFGDPEISVGTVNHLKETLRDEKLGPIPGTKVEVETLGRLYGAARSELFIGKQATEENAKTEMPRFKVLHFATHGILDSQDPLYSHILLSQSGANEDGLLEAREIMNLNLNADIAILSACDTARGRISSGEGVIGMSWAFFVAGCPTTVVSQWSVNSESTTKLMIEFHRALLSRNRGSNRMRNAAEALRDAQLAMLKTQSYRHPLYWAGFVVIGDGW